MIKRSFALLLLLFILPTKPLFARAAWWIGPLLAPAGHTIPKGHTNFEPYFFYTQNYGFITETPSSSPYVRSTNYIISPVLTHGFTDNIDLQFSVPYVYNAKARASAQGITDIAITLGYQLTEQSTSRYWPDIRLTLQQIFPVGKYLDLDPLHNGTDAIGLGSYQTGLGIIFQHVKEFKDDHYLRTRLSFNLLLPANVSVTGFNSFGGASDTKGVVTPGRFFGVDLAGEYNLTQNWVAVMEFYYSNRVASGFSGYPGRDAYGKLAQVGLPSSAEYSLAPAIEYNFTPNLGMIVGYWFTIAGHETTKYKSVVLALNTFW